MFPYFAFPLQSKFLDKPSETSFVVLSLNNSKSKTSFYLELYSLIRNFDLRFAPVEVTHAREKQNKSSLSFAFPLTYS